MHQAANARLVEDGVVGLAAITGLGETLEPAERSLLLRVLRRPSLPTRVRVALVDVVARGELPAAFADSDDPDRLVPIVTEPSKLVIAVAGDPNRTNAYVFSNDGPHGDWTAAPVDRSPSADLVCRI